MNSAVAIIPARGGSKRIPHKNIREFHGLPILVYSIKAAIASGCFDRIVVSTDDDGIAAIARQNGAETPFKRPADLADDHTGTTAVIRHALQWLSGRGQNFETACCIYPTAPFLDAASLREGLTRLKDSGCSFAFSVSAYVHPVQRALRMLPDGTLEALYPEYSSVRSQDLEPSFHDAGQFYWGWTAAFLEERRLFSSESVGVILPSHLVHDIDTIEDWKRAELAFAALRARGRC
jgi:pseudaminic acid cytidylyltransferase